MNHDDFVKMYRDEDEAKLIAYMSRFDDFDDFERNGIDFETRNSTWWYLNNSYARDFFEYNKQLDRELGDADE